MVINGDIPAGKLLQKTMERSTMLFMGNFTISMVIFHSYVSHYQRVKIAKKCETLIDLIVENIFLN